ncbi:MAG: hypothetical protein K2W82_18860 [Candidatus Obscuribacterales bacterium]|nr:hypothetical protein [Candidatus Obscuribacterales bacterium]
MFEKYSESAGDILFTAYSNSKQFKADEISSAHILLALASEKDNLAAVALRAMNVSSEQMRTELERLLLVGKKKDIAPLAGDIDYLWLDELRFADGAKLVLRRAYELSLFLGHKRVEPEHLLLAIIDTADDAAMKLLDEVAANCTYMRRLVINLVAEQDSLKADIPSFRRTVVDGISALIASYCSVLDDIEALSERNENRLSMMPQKNEVARLVFTAYMPDFLFMQAGYQRYLLDETLGLLRKRAGTLDPEFSASTISASAQNLRQEVRTTIEYIWGNELRLLKKLPDEADYDLIGSVIEDLWWTHSEEIALNEVFDEALDDHRRKQMLNLQKRRLEISERFKKLEKRLRDTFKQCCTKAFVSA